MEDEVLTGESEFDYSSLQEDIDTLLSQNQLILEDLSGSDTYYSSVLEQGQQIIDRLDKLQLTFSIIVCFLIGAALVFAFKAFYRFLNNFF